MGVLNTIPPKLVSTNEQSKQMGITTAQRRLGSEWNKTMRALNSQEALNVFGYLLDDERQHMTCLVVC